MNNLTKKEILLILAIGILVIAVIGYYIYTLTQQNDYQELEDAVDNTQEAKEIREDEEEIIIHIAGEVNTPGIVKIKEGARIADVIEKAGGLTQNANIKNVNLAYEVEDGQKITIPGEEQQEEYITEDSGEGVIQENQTGGTNKKVNINNANQTELTTLPGIGENTAQKIIDYREQNGKFNTIEDIKNVSGIGDSKYENIKEYITIK